MLSKVAFKVGYKDVDVQGWQFNDADGGHDQLSGVMTQDRYREVGSPTQGSAVSAWTGAECLWAGRLAAPPQMKDGLAVFNALGYKEKAEKKTDRLFIQSRDMGIWVPYDSEPHIDGSEHPAYDHSRKVGLDSTKGALRFSLERSQGMSTADAAAFIFYAEGVELRRVAFNMTYDAADEFTKLEIETKRANGPLGSDTSVDTYNVGSGNRDAAKSSTWATAGMDLVTVGLQCNDGTFSPNVNAMRWMLTHVRVNSDITSADTYNAYEVVSYIGTQLGWDTSGIATSTYDVMPFDWQGSSWMEAARYLAEIEDKFVRVGAPTATGPLVEYNAWGTTDWTVYQGDGADPDLKPLELFNAARVYYETAAGVPRKKTRTCADASLTDPLSASGITNTYEYELEDVQKGSTLATNVADKLVTRFSQQKYAGTINVVAARSTKGTNPRKIRYGDTVTIADFAPAKSMTLRVVEVSQAHDSVTVGVEQPVNIPYLIEHTRARKRRKRRKHAR